MSFLWQDLKYAARSLRQSPSFTVAALITLILGIGLNAAMFSVAHAVLWRTLPYPDPSRLVMVGEVDQHDPSAYWGATYPTLQDWRAHSVSFEHLAGMMDTEHILREGAEPVRVSGAAVSASFFDVMGVTPSVGRVFSETDDRRGAPGVIVISHRLWMGRFSADSNVVGRQIRFGKAMYTVIGVMPQGFEFHDAEYWIPLEQEIDPGFVNRRNVWVLGAIGRLRSGSSLTSAQADIETINAGVRRTYPEARRELVVRVAPLQYELSRDLRPAVLVLLGAVGFVLLIVCANMAALMIVRGSARSREMAIRSALGVSWSRLVRLPLAETALLGAAGGLMGVGFALAAIRALALLTKDARLLDIPMDGSVLGFALAVTISTTIVFGIAPAMRTARVNAGEALKSGGHAGIAPGRMRAQRLLVVGEVALCVILLTGAGLLWKSFQRVFDVHPGFLADHLIVMHVGLPQAYDSNSAVDRFYRTVSERLSALPGVSGVTIASRLPISGGEGFGDIAIEGRPSNGPLGVSTFRNVMPNYFAMMGIPLIRGRAFADRDEGSAGRITIINEGFARHFWGNDDPVGKRVRIGPAGAPWMMIVGVVGDVHQVGLDTPSPFSTYEPITLSPRTRFEVALRSIGDPASVMASVRSQLRSVEPALLVEQMQTMSERLDVSVSPRRLNLVLFELFAALALLLAGTGLYGVVSYTTVQRTREFGIRMALGARSGDITRLVLRQGLQLAVAGIAIGLLAAINLARLMKGLLFGVQTNDPETFVAVAVLLTGAAIAACWIPASRAKRVAPIRTLRED
ncbi:MAG TPA: ABC transporter permease [Bryobacteraceae bacterium]|nr:ABC transporter permease [Bryobacteraceae bacterium]